MSQLNSAFTLDDELPAYRLVVKLIIFSPGIPDSGRFKLILPYALAASKPIRFSSQLGRFSSQSGRFKLFSHAL